MEFCCTVTNKESDFFFKVKESFTFKMDIFQKNKYIKVNLLGEQLLLSSSISSKLFFSEVVPELILLNNLFF